MIPVENSYGSYLFFLTLFQKDKRVPCVGVFSPYHEWPVMDTNLLTDFISSKQIRIVYLILNSWPFVSCFDFPNYLPYTPHTSLAMNTVPSMIIITPKNIWMSTPFLKFPARIVHSHINNRPEWWCHHIGSSELWIIQKNSVCFDTENKTQMQAKFWNQSLLEQKTNCVKARVKWPTWIVWEKINYSGWMESLQLSKCCDE